MNLQEENAGLDLFADGACVVEGVPDPVDGDEVRRYLGYPRRAAPARRIEDVT